MIKLIVCDYDGTLRPYTEKAVSVETLKQMKIILDNGLKVCISSGRPFQELYELFGELSDRLYFASFNGALLTYGKKTIWQRSFSPGALQSLTSHFLRDKDARIRLFGKTDIYGYRSRYENDLPVSRYTDIKEDIFMIEAERTAYRFDPGDYCLFYGDAGICEYIPPFTDKGVNLADLQMHLGVSRYETAAIGDAKVDIPMFRQAEYCYSVGEGIEGEPQRTVHVKDALVMLKSVEKIGKRE